MDAAKSAAKSGIKMNKNAEDVIKSLIKAREFVRHESPTHFENEDVDAVWEGYLTVIATVYTGESYELIYKAEKEPE